MVSNVNYGMQPMIYASNNANNVTYRGSADNQRLYESQKHPHKKEKSGLAKFMTWLTIAGLSTVAAVYGVNKFKISQNMEILSKKLNEASKTELKEALSKYSTNSRRIITKELVNNKEFGKSKIKDLVNKIAKDNKIIEEDLFQRALNNFMIIP